MSYGLLAVALGVGFVLGAVWHHREVRRICDEYAEELAAAEADVSDVMTCYTERSDDDILRLYEMDTDRFLAQGENAIAVTYAFADRFPGYRIFLAETDEDVIAELGLDPDAYDFQEK